MTQPTEHKIKVKRSDGRIQSLSPEQLDELNEKRKRKDQMNAGSRSGPKTLNRLSLLVFIGLLSWLVFTAVVDRNSRRGPLVAANPPEVKQEQSLEPETKQIHPETPDPVSVRVDTATTAPTPQPTATPVLPEPVPDIPSSASVSLHPEVKLQIQVSILDWAQAWSEQDYQRYLNYYSDKFEPANGQNIHRWKTARRARILNPDWIEVEIRDLDIQLETRTTAKATFLQIYRSPNYMDESHKLIYLELVSGRWKIVAEGSRLLNHL